MRRLPLPLVLLALLLLGLLVDVGTARPASAHAALVSATPAEDARLSAAPEAVQLTFSEGVSLGAGYARVLAAGGDRVDTGAAAVSGDVLGIPLQRGLPAGSYVVTWRVVSADSHPVSGAYAFVVGDGELVPATSAEDGAGIDPAIGAALPIARGLGYGGLAVGIGVPVLLLSCWPGGWAGGLAAIGVGSGGVGSRGVGSGGAASSRLRRLTSAGLAAVGVGAVLSFLLQGPYSAGSGLGRLLDPELLSATASSAYGVTLLLRALLALLLAAALALCWRRAAAPGTPAVVALGVLAAGLVLSTSAVGHPVAGSLSAVAVAVATAHVLAMVVWLGGLTGLLAALLRQGVPADELRSALPRFSRIAFGSVLVLVLSGVLQSVREVGSVAALVSTTYGWLLVGKLVLVALVLAVAGVSRVWVQQHVGAVPSRRLVGAVTAQAYTDQPAGPGAQESVAGPADLRPLRRSVLVELAVAAVVLGVSAVLVGTAPAAATAAAPVDVTLPLQGSAGSAGNGSVEVSVDPAAPGPTALHVYLFDDGGQLVQPRDIDVALTERAQQIGPLVVRLEPGGPGHWTGVDVAFPTAGRWTVTVTVRVDEFTAVTASTVVPVR